jgi:hypothetical protein
MNLAVEPREAPQPLPFSSYAYSWRRPPLPPAAVADVVEIAGNSEPDIDQTAAQNSAVAAAEMAERAAAAAARKRPEDPAA